MSLSDERNWDDYFYGFCESFKYIEEDLTDPDRFPKGMSRDGASGYACIILCNMMYIIHFIIMNTIHFVKLQTNEIRVASGYHSEFMRYTVSSNVPWTQTATGDLATFKLMSW